MKKELSLDGHKQQNSNLPRSTDESTVELRIIRRFSIVEGSENMIANNILTFRTLFKTIL